MQLLISISVGALLSLFVFACIVQVTDTEDYHKMHVDPVSGLSIYNQNSSYYTAGSCFENVVQINNLGFHGPPVSLEKGRDVFRIVVLGASLIEARQVPVSEMFSTLLQDKLNANPNKKYTYEVIPMGMGGNRLLTSALYYVSYGSPLKPDLVIDFDTQYELLYSYGVFNTDAQGNAVLEIPKTSVGADSIKTRIADELRRVKLFVNLYNRYLIVRDNVSAFLAHPLFFLPSSVPALGEAGHSTKDTPYWQEQNAVLGALAQRVQDDHARLLVASWVIPGNASTSTIQEFPIRLEEIAMRSHFYYTDLIPAFNAREAAAGKPTSWACDVHWTPEGHEYFADALYGYLSTHSVLVNR